MSTSTPKTNAVTAESASSTPVGTIMTRDVVTVRSGTSVEAVVELMLARGLSRLPVVDQEFRPLGIVSKTDLVEDAHDRGDTAEAPAERPANGFHVQSEGAVVDEVM